MSVMPLHDKESIERVMNLVCPSDIYYVYEDKRPGEIINNEGGFYDAGECNQDNSFELEDIHLERVTDDRCDQHINEINIKNSSDEEENRSDAVRRLTVTSMVDTSLLSRLSSTKFAVEHDADTISCGGNSYKTESSFARREIPDHMQKSLRLQLARFLEKSEKSLSSRGDKSHISKLRIRKRALEMSCREPKLLHSQLVI